MKLDVDHITQLICEVAEEEIMPRFRKLSTGDVMEKSPGDIVTTADIEAEKKLTQRLMDFLPGSLVVGEEEAHRNPKTLAYLKSDHPVWIIDPVDGTRNFSKGIDIFGSMVVLAHKGELIASWIHDPARARTAVAESGAGATLAGHRLHIEANHDSLEYMTVSLNPSHQKWLKQVKKTDHSPLPTMAPRHGSVAHDYISLATGEFQAAQYRRLQPWDHAPGVLLFREAGGFDQMIACRTRYHAQTYSKDCLLLTPNKAVWELTRSFLNPGSESFHA